MAVDGEVWRLLWWSRWNTVTGWTGVKKGERSKSLTDTRGYHQQASHWHVIWDSTLLKTVGLRGTALPKAQRTWIAIWFQWTSPVTTLRTVAWESWLWDSLDKGSEVSSLSGHARGTTTKTVAGWGLGVLVQGIQPSLSMGWTLRTHHLFVSVPGVNTYPQAKRITKRE